MQRRHYTVVWELVFLAGIMAVLGIPLTKEALAADPVTLKLYNPTGAFEVTQAFAPRLADLNGKTICEVSNGSWEYDRTFPAIRALLQKQFPSAKFVTYDKIPTVLTTSDIPNLEEAVKAAGCQGAIVGNAG